MIIKRYLILSRSLELKPQSQMQLTIIHKIPFGKGSYNFVRDIIRVFFAPLTERLLNMKKEKERKNYFISW